MSPQRTFIGDSVRRSGAIVVHRLGLPRRPFDDIYHLLMTARWRVLFLAFAGVFGIFNSIFAGLYMWGGDCIEHANPGSFADHFFFSVQTLATIGYGLMAPKTVYAHIIVSIEAMTGLFIYALTTGLLFAKFARPTARVLFSRKALITPVNGVPTLIFRMANIRTNQIVDAMVRVSLLRDEVTKEGMELRRFYDLPLVRNHSPAFFLSWTVMHRIDATSPLAADIEELKRGNTELVVSLTGTDGDFSQNVHARHLYRLNDLQWGGTFADTLSENADGSRTIDFSKFDTILASS